MDGHDDWRMHQVLVALDSVADRIDLQASLPNWIANGWTKGGEAGLSVHDAFDGPYACLTCLYIPKGEAPNDDRIIAQALSLTSETDVRDIRARLDLHSPLDETFLARVAQAKGIPMECLMPFKGRPVRALYIEGICGGQLLQFMQGQEKVVGEVPMAFQSAYAGILVAAALVARHLGRPRVPNLTQVDLLRPFPDIPSQWRLKEEGSRCICRDADYLAVYREKYEATS